jgi:predicted dehydrogenase
MSKVRLGIVGLGNMGATHASNILAGKVPGLELGAVVDVDPARPARFPDVKSFATLDDMAASGTIDAVLIATPHFDHTTLGIKALRAGLHVLVEKPVSVHKADVERLVAAHTNPKQVFAAVFNQRTDPFYLAIRDLIRNGELGQVRRVNWIITNWFRTEHYYASGGWRATWAGEGGGVLLNQCPHNLDLFQWLFGMPQRVRAHCGFGRYHDIEVEDDVTAFLEYADGATGTFITSTGEAPGTNRLEITGENGKVVYESDQIRFDRNERPMTEFSRTVPEAFARPITMETRVAAPDHGGQHVEILQNFTDAILDGKPLIAPASEGIHSVELANAMLMSAWTGETVSLPLDAKRYEKLLNEKIAGSRAKKKPTPAATVGGDFAKSFGR